MTPHSHQAWGNRGTILRKDGDWWSLVISSSVVHFLTHVVWTVIYLFRFFFSLSHVAKLEKKPEPTVHQQADTHVRLSLSHFENYPDPPTSPEREKERQREGRLCEVEEEAEAGMDWAGGGAIPVCMRVFVYVSVCLFEWVRERERGGQTDGGRGRERRREGVHV